MPCTRGAWEDALSSGLQEVRPLRLQVQPAVRRLVVELGDVVTELVRVRAGFVGPVLPFSSTIYEAR